MSMKNSNDTIENRTRDLPACSTVPQPNVPPCTACYCVSTDIFPYLYRCPRRNVSNFGRVFLMLKYTDITKNTYVQSWTVMEIMAREKCGILAGPRTVPVSWQHYSCPSLSVVSYYGNSAHARNKLFMYFLLGEKAVQVSAWYSCPV